MIKLIALDVDGTLTKGEIIYSTSGEEIKNFNVKDGLGINAAVKAGYIVAIITGRESEVVARRAKDFGVTEIHQGVSNKIKTLEALCTKYKIGFENIAFMGDDLNDLAAILCVNYSGAPKDATDEILEVATYVSSKKGGDGAVRDFIETIMKKDGKWHEVVERYKNVGGRN